MRKARGKRKSEIASRDLSKDEKGREREKGKKGGGEVRCVDRSPKPGLMGVGKKLTIEVSY